MKTKSIRGALLTFLVLCTVPLLAGENFSMVIQKGHSDEIRLTAFSPDGRFYCTSTESGGTKLWDVHTGALIKDIYTNEMSRWTGLFTPDSKGIVKYSDSELSIWDLKEEKIVKTIKVDLKDINHTQINVSRDCRLFAVLLYATKKVIVFNTENLKEKCTIQYQPEENSWYKYFKTHNSCNFSFDNRFIITQAKLPSKTGYASKEIHVWDTDSGQLVRTFEQSEFIDVSRNSSTILINNFINKKGYYHDSTEEMSYEVRDIATGSLLKTIMVKSREKEKDQNGKTAEINNSITGFAKDDKILWKVYCTDFLEFKIFDTSNSAFVYNYKNNNFRDYWFSPDGRYIERRIIGGMQPDWYEILNASDYSTISSYKLQKTTAANVRFSGDGSLFYSSEGKEIVVRKTEDLSIVKKICSSNDDIATYSISPDCKLIATIIIFPWDKNVKINVWNLETGAKLFEKTIQYAGKLHFSEDSRYLTYTVPVIKKQEGYMDSLGAMEIHILNAKTGAPVKIITAKNDIHNSKQLGPEIVYMINDKKALLSTSSYIQMFEGDGFKNIKTVYCGDTNYPIPLRQTALFKNTKYMAVSELNGIKIIEIDTGKTLMQLAPERECPALALNSDGTVLAMYFYNWYGKEVPDFNAITLFDTKTGRLLKVLKGHSGSVYSFAFSPDGKYGISASSDGSSRIWNLETGKSMAFLENEKKEWIIFTNEGYFDASKNGGSNVVMTSGIDSFGVDQFALKNNRPDLIYKSVGLGSPELIEHYYRQYLRRLRKSGFSESDLSSELHVPEAKIITAKQDGKNITVECALSDSEYRLRKYNVYVNDVPVFGAEGRDITGRSKMITEKLELTTGRNKIEVSCINEKGAESYRTLTFAEYKEKPKGNLYYIGFGVSRYRDASLNLKYADKDAKDIADMYSGMKSKYGNVYIKTYLNEEVTVENIKKAKELLKNAKPEDTFVLFIAGHGVHDRDKEATYYYLTHDADRNNLAGTCANFELIEDLLQGIAPRNKLFLMDTCESGEVDDDDQNRFYAAAGSRGLKARTARALSVTGKGAPPRRSYLFQKDRYIYNDLTRRSGAIVFSSSKGGEFSYESDKIQNGYFTKEIITAIKIGAADKNGDGQVSTDELREYVSQSVAKATGDLQHPTVDRDNLYQRFGFPAR